MVLSVGFEPELKSVIDYLTTGMAKADSSKLAKAIKVRARNYAMYDYHLYRRTAKGLRFIPAEEERMPIMEGLRDEIGDSAFAATYKIISDRFWWPRMGPDIAYFVRSCDPCQKSNPP